MNYATGRNKGHFGQKSETLAVLFRNCQINPSWKYPKGPHKGAHKKEVSGKMIMVTK